MSKFINKKLLGYIALALVCVMAGTLIGSTMLTAEADTVVLTSPFTEAVAKVRGSVVGVNNYQLITYNNNGGSGYGYFPWSDYFGFGNGFGNGYGYGYGNGRNNNETSKEVQYGSGSGVVVSKEYVLTNYHVVEDASSLKVSVTKDDVSDPDLYDATVAAYDSDKDVAVLYVPGLDLEPVELGDSDTLQIGDWAICIGNPLGFTGTVTTGIVSALDRQIASGNTTTDKYGRKSNAVNTMIQTDAAINSGNSGGGMFNTAGQLVGIPSLKYSGSRSFNSPSTENIGMCIPINEAKPVIEEALNADVTVPAESGTDTQGNSEAGQNLKGKPRMGVTVTTISTADGSLPNGAYIIEVDKDSPAEKGGLLAGDIVVEANGQVVNTVSEMQGIIAELNEGDTIQLKVFRPAEVFSAADGNISTEGDYVDVEVTLAIVDAVAQ